MKLREFLETLETDQMIKIGAKDGTGFFYIGNPWDMLSTFKPENKRYCEYNKIIYAANDNLINKLKSEISAMYSGLAEEYKDAGNVENILRAVFRSGKAKDILRNENRWDKAVTQQTMTKPLEEREVLESFMSDPIADEDVYAIIVEGYEYGRFWVKEEAPTGLGGRIKPSFKINNMEGD